MDLQQIRNFLTLAQELHFWNTAEKVYITQSALSRQIKSLEDELGVTLFERNKRRVKLTEAGAFLRDKWLPLMDEISRIHRQAQRIHEGAYGSISIGYPGSVTYGILQELIASIDHLFPDLRVELFEPTDISFEQLLLNYQMDLALRRDPAENPALQSIWLYSEQFALIVPDGHAVNQENFTGLLDVKDEKFIISGLHHKTFYVSNLRMIFDHYGIDPNIHIESDFGGVILSLVARGLGVSILPSSYSFSAPPNVRFINLPFQVDLHVIWRKEDNRPVLHNILKEIQQLANKFKTS
ncbi:LysR family transcriptional regulator [Telluribacter humicola]|uniref:LysR family transcriptional regulator n=1 Tax=Telluribacter humicola TaxID=1720261 RepID=UPI001A95D13C|nr:LysR family transcriptional regulator [Telluribacter humicola]